MTDAAKRNDPEFIPNISEIWASDRPSWRIVNEYLEQLQRRRQLTERDKDAIGKNLDRLFDLQKYPFTALEIASPVDEESVANIFVRINSDGVKLNQADFILTLLSVFWDEGRAALESFSRASRIPALPGQPSPFNYFLQPSPDQLLRVSVAYGFHRGRLRSVYHLLRGKDLETGRVTEAQRDAQFAKLREAQGQVLHLTNWKLFLDCLVGAGFRSGQEISSSNSLLFSYAFFLIGRLQCGVEVHALQRLIGRWFFATTLTGRYSSSPETDVEADLVRIREVQNPPAFIEALERIIAGTLTNDFWTIALPIALESAAGRSPALFAFYASQNRLGAPVLFSDRKISELLDPTVRGPKKSLERHHLFPRDWLEDSGVADLKQINQLANLALMEWPDNIAVGASPPREYVPELRKRFSSAAWERMSRLHALPTGWEEMEYGTFLQQRRVLMAALIRRGFESLSLTPTEDDLPMVGTADERTVWALIESAELSLRAFVDAKYHERWGQAAEAQIRKLLGEEVVKVLERNREKHAGQYPLTPAAVARPLIDYTYLGQLGQLMLVNDGWQLFQKLFTDKRQLEDILKAITPVRNDFAHFRSVPERELQRCRIAAEDLLALISRGSSATS